MTDVSAAAYTIRGLDLGPGGQPLLTGVDVSIPAGEITAVVGPNGVGKTSLLKFLAFLSPMPCAEMSFFGRSIAVGGSDWQQCRQRVTYVAQAPFLFRGSVRDNVAFGLAARGCEDARRVDEALAQVGLGALAGRNAQRLSGGEAQRVAWARALAIDPEVYLLDEATAHVDRDVVPVLEEILRRLVQRGRTVVFATHSVAQAYRLGARVLSLDRGGILPFPMVNVWRADIVGKRDGLVRLGVGNRELLVAAAIPNQGSCLVSVDPESILLARERLPSSARNCWLGVVTGIEGDQVALSVTLDCGVPVVARLTASAARELQVMMGTPLYAVFKASAVHVLASPSAADRGVG